MPLSPEKSSFIVKSKLKGLRAGAAGPTDEQKLALKSMIKSQSPHSNLQQYATTTPKKNKMKAAFTTNNATFMTAEKSERSNVAIGNGGEKR